MSATKNRPPPAMERYPFKNPPYAHQAAYLSRFWGHPGVALFAEMGTGKSYMLINNAAMLYDQGLIDAVLVVAPKGVYGNWERIEIPKHLPDHVPRAVAKWVPSPRKAEQARMDKMLEAVDSLRILVMNVEAFRTARGTAFARTFVRATRCMMVIDESTTIKNHRAKQTQSITKVGRDAQYRRIATGSPITKSPLDLFGQCGFLGDSYLDMDSYYAFQARYAILVERKLPTHSFKQVVGYRRLDELQHMLSLFSFRVTKEECLDLPDKIYTLREVELTPEQLKAYDQMRRAALSLFEEGQVTTQNALTQLLRLHQILCGHVKLDDGQVKELPSNRIDELLSAIEETDGKVIIWATYRRDIEAIKLALQSAYGMDSVATYYGDTVQDERQRIVDHFQDPASPLRFFVANAGTGGYGLTLTQAKTVIYYSNSFDLEERLQSEDRAHRIGQVNKVTYIDLVAPGTVDEHIVKALREKINIATAVLGEDFREWLI